MLQFATHDIKSFDYFSLATARNRKEIEVSEVSGVGDVESLLIFNSSKKYVLIMDGDVVDEDEQKRIVNTSVL